MLDKMIFNVGIDFEKEAFPMAIKNNLLECNEGAERYFKTSKMEQNVTGIAISIKQNKVQIKCSLHKFYSRVTRGEADNSNQFTMLNAKVALQMLFEYIGVLPGSAKISYFEIGLNIPTDRPPIEYIRKIQSIGNIKKEFFIDANYEINRQRTTAKHKTIKKVFKIYDKGYEMCERNCLSMIDTPYILRIETIYRRQSIKASDFFGNDNIYRLSTMFYNNWSCANFERVLMARQGIKLSQKEKARNILLYGIPKYLDKSHEALLNGTITPKTYRGIREFCNNWNIHKKDYSLNQSQEELEFKIKLLSYFKICKVLM